MTAVQAMKPAAAYDRSSVEAVIKLYFDGLYESDVGKLTAAFHPTADLRWQDKGELQVLTVPDWMERVAKRASAQSQGHARHDFIVSMDRSDEATAFVKVHCALLPRFFTDYLVLLKLTDGWRIVSKSYRYDVRE
ncbi:MAG: nuclear transport factor 2 family protein [Phreatobacter sp.]|uniref:nuclear transport factor 2 family protein n=1 Tax=Phreatobacter sp. TaxID=1966341 RepID=UPI0027335FDD|nr:nuclear transport factor 2 family protein [Phreatobacter sp.]MDP2801762.1 nuclear transport factor 2 family protein [Phreatobacter sp.]